MKCFLCNFLRYCLLIYTIVATGGTIITRTRMTKTTTTKTTIMTIETSPMVSNNCQANVECCYYQEALEQQQQHQHLSGKKDIKLTKREIDERLQQPFTVMQSIEEEMEPEEEEEKETKKNSLHQNDHVDDNVYDDEEYEKNPLEENEYDENVSIEDDEDDEDEDEDEEVKANKKGIRRRRRRKKRKRKNGNKGTKRKRRRKKHQHVTVSPLGQPANLLLASLTQLPTAPPIHYAHKYKPHGIKRKKIIRTTTTPKPKLKPLKYILHKGNLIKKKKQEYLSHLGSVFLPFVKFVAFFTVLNPFTLAVFFFMLISPVVFGLLGFTAISFILRPAMNLLFAVKHRIGNINRNNRRYRHKQHRKHNHIAPRPITIHKHFYPQPHPNVHAPLFLRKPKRPLLYRPHRHPHPHRADNDRDISFHNSTEENGLVNVQQTHQNFNPLLPQVRQQLKQIQPPVGLSTRFILPSL